jgi:hypothetical protein
MLMEKWLKAIALICFTLLEEHIQQPILKEQALFLERKLESIALASQLKTI